MNDLTESYSKDSEFKYLDNIMKTISTIEGDIDYLEDCLKRKFGTSATEYTRMIYLLNHRVLDLKGSFEYMGDRLKQLNADVKTPNKPSENPDLTNDIGF